MGKGGNKSQEPQTIPAEETQLLSAKWEQVCLIDGVEYDVTDFVRKHPGGSVIRYSLANTGADATPLFNAFHLRSKKARMVLKSLPQRTPQLSIQPGQLLDETSEGKMLKNFEVFENELREEGFFEPSIVHNVYRISELVTMFAFGLYCYSFQTPVMIALGIVVHGVFGARCGWVQHEGGHGSMTNDIGIGKRIQSFFIGFGLGTNGDMWNHMHNKHHAATQKISHDLDLDTTPLVAFFNTAFESNRARGAVGFNRFWAKFQAFTFLPITSGVFVMLFWLLFLHPREMIRKRNWESGLYMLSSHIVRTVLFKHFAGFESWTSAYLVGYWGAMWVSGMYLFGHFSLSHTHLAVIDRDEHKNWVRFAVDHTVDIATSNPLVNWIMGYLNCQVIHHLFPGMPQFRQPEVSRRFAIFAKENGLNYHVVGYFEAWKLMLGNLHSVGEHYYENAPVPIKKE